MSPMLVLIRTYSSGDSLALLCPVFGASPANVVAHNTNPTHIIASRRATKLIIRRFLVYPVASSSRVPIAEIIRRPERALLKFQRIDYIPIRDATSLPPTPLHPEDPVHAMAKGLSYK
jgi:hypothetical protein